MDGTKVVLIGHEECNLGFNYMPLQLENFQPNMVEKVTYSMEMNTTARRMDVVVMTP